MNNSPSKEETVSEPGNAKSVSGDIEQIAASANKKTLKERFNDNSIIFVCGLIVTAFGGGFSSGWAYTQYSHDSNGMVSITKNEYDRLKNSAVSPMSPTPQLQRSNPSKEIAFSSMKERSRFFELLVDYFTMEGGQESRPYYKTEVLEYKISEPTNDFTWALNPRCLCAITGRGFKISPDGSIRPLDFEIVLPGRSLNIKINEPNKGDILVAVVRLSADQSFGGVNSATLESIAK